MADSTPQPPSPPEAQGDATTSNNAAAAAAAAAAQEEELPPPTLCGTIVACLGCLCFIPIACATLWCSCATLCCCVGLAAADNAVHKAQGQRWDGVQSKWVVDKLDEEEKQVPVDDEDILQQFSAGKDEEEEQEPVEGASATAQVKETEYYDLLGVSPSADDSKIKRCYYLQARKWHPDKNPSDQAKAKFQAIGEAYQVLSDEKLRAVYDSQGKDGLSGDKTEVAMDQVDPSLIFTFLFGNDSFQDIIGRLQLVTQTLVAGGSSDTTGTDPQRLKPQLQELERRRVVRLAVALRNRIQLYVDGHEQGAKEQWKQEGAKLVEVRYGEPILNTVGSMYKLVSKQVIGSWSEGIDAKYQAAEMKLDAAKNAATAQRTAASTQEQDAALPAMMEVMWNITVIDISTTLREVVLKVLKDQSVSDDIRQKRAHAVQQLGILWEEQKHVGQADGSQKSARNLYMSATAAAMEATLNKMKKEEEQHSKEQQQQSK